MTDAVPLPHWPRRMQVALAAAYCGVSATKFLTGVHRGRYPKGVKDGGNTLWYIEDLDEALDRMKPGGGPSGDPYDEALDDERDDHLEARP